jgi:integrase
MKRPVSSEATDREAMESKGDGLYLRRRGTTASWFFRYQQLGRRQTVHIGSATEFTLRQARDMVADMRRAMARGDSPKAALARPTDARSFGQAIEDYIVSAAPAWRGKNEETHTRNQLTHHWATLLRTPVQAIRKEQLVPILRAAAASPSVYEKLLSRTRAVFRREAALDNIRQQPIDWDGLKFVVRAAHVPVQHHPAVPWQAAPEVYAPLAPRWTPAACCLRLLVLTATRSGEARGARWDEFSGLDGDDPRWSISAERMKMARPHVIPLPKQAVAILREMPKVEGSPLLFPGRTGKPLTDMGLLKEQRLLDKVDTVHGWRSSFRDWGAENKHDSLLLELSLAHLVGGAVERAYARSSLLDLRRPVLQAWADHVTGG